VSYIKVPHQTHQKPHVNGFLLTSETQTIVAKERQTRACAPQQRDLAQAQIYSPSRAWRGTASPVYESKMRLKENRSLREQVSQACSHLGQSAVWHILDHERCASFDRGGEAIGERVAHPYIAGTRYQRVFEVPSYEISSGRRNVT
jgi:hypothetical protein